MSLAKVINSLRGFPFLRRAYSCPPVFFWAGRTLTIVLMLLLALLMVSSISYPKIRDVRAMALFGLIFLAAGWFIFRQNDIIYAALLVIMLIMLYLASPVVISRLQKRK